MARGRPLRVRLEAARPTIDVNGIEKIRSSLQPGDRVVCTDELACLMLVGRIDAWLALDDYVRERFVIRRVMANSLACTPASRLYSARLNCSTRHNAAIAR